MITGKATAATASPENTAKSDIYGSIPRSEKEEKTTAAAKNCPQIWKTEPQALTAKIENFPVFLSKIIIIRDIAVPQTENIREESRPKNKREKKLLKSPKGTAYFSPKT